jgi:hypothetical protein
MDLRRGEYFGFDRSSAVQWLRIQRGDAEDPAARAMIAQARTMGWIVDAPASARAPVRPAARARASPSVLLAWRCMAHVVIGLKLRGFGGAYARALALDAALPAQGSSPESVERVLRAFARAESVVLPGLGFTDCLPRSLALFSFLRRCGLAATHRIGVQRFPFFAHAWVEHGGVVLRDRADAVSKFTPIATIGG